MKMTGMFKMRNMLKRLAVMAVMIVLTVALGTAAEEKSATKTTDPATLKRNVATFKRLIEEGWNNRNMDVVDELVADYCLFYVNGALQEETGPKLMKKVIASNLRNFPGFRMTVEDIFGAEDRVVIRYLFKGTHQRLGKDVTQYAAVIARFLNGKMVMSRTFDDKWQIYKQLGFKLTPPSAADRQPETGAKE